MSEAATAADVVALISMSLRRERARTGLSLTEVAKRAGLAKSVRLSPDRARSRRNDIEISATTSAAVAASDTCSLQTPDRSV